VCVDTLARVRTNIARPLQKKTAPRRNGGTPLVARRAAPAGWSGSAARDHGS